MDNINDFEIRSLIEHFEKNTYRVSHGDPKAKEIMDKCILLAKKDYNVTVVENKGGELANHYPSHILLMAESEGKGVTIDPARLRDLMAKARYARCRTRCPVPVIFVDGKLICRSSTLAGSTEVITRSYSEYFYGGGGGTGGGGGGGGGGDEGETNDKKNVTNGTSQATNGTSAAAGDMCETARHHDIKLLKAMDVTTIVDFMVENKKVKFGFKVSSSEKVDKVNRYADFSILCLPYPGCEFFRDFRARDYSADGLVFDWDQSYVDAEIVVPPDDVSQQMDVTWRDYKSWDLVQITQNYLRLLVRYASGDGAEAGGGGGGMLVHCISGWDRTPLFVSLLRMVLWADGRIHRSLTPLQMLYFTVAYDWYLFSHDLHDRKSKGEDIFYFCFFFLKHVMSDEFSSQRQRQREKGVAVERMEVDGGGGSECGDGSSDTGEPTPSQGSSVSLSEMPWSANHDCEHLIVMDGGSEGDGGNGGLWLGESPGSSVSSVVTLVEGGVAMRYQASPGTSPVAVPPRAKRNRTESSSSLSVGSWQHVTSTGSLRSTNSGGSTHSRTSGERTDSGGGGGGASQSSVAESISEADAAAEGQGRAERGVAAKQGPVHDHSQCDAACAIRRERLENVRRLFLCNYCSSVGLNLKHQPPQGAVSQFLGNIAGRLYPNSTSTS